MTLSRRDFLRVSKDYGTKAALFAAVTGTAGSAIGTLAAKQAHAAKKAKYKFRWGATVVKLDVP